MTTLLDKSSNVDIRNREGHLRTRRCCCHQQPRVVRRAPVTSSCILHPGEHDISGLDVDLMLGQRRRRWANIKPASISQLLSAGSELVVCLWQCCHHVSSVVRWGNYNHEIMTRTHQACPIGRSALKKRLNKDVDSVLGHICDVGPTQSRPTLVATLPIRYK